MRTPSMYMGSKQLEQRCALLPDKNGSLPEDGYRSSGYALWARACADACTARTILS